MTFLTYGLGPQTVTGGGFASGVANVNMDILYVDADVTPLALSAETVEYLDATIKFIKDDGSLYKIIG